MEGLRNSLLNIVMILAISTIFLACQEKETSQLIKEGSYRGTIHMQSYDLPFTFTINKEGEDYSASLINGPEETIPLDEIMIVGDSVFITLHIFDIELRAKINGDELDGLYIKNYKENYRVPFTAVHGKSTRFDTPQTSSEFDGSWQTIFVENDSTSYPAIGIFKKEGDLLKGTFLTETGDYRYLEGYTKENEMSLYTFDGNHAFIFKAQLENDSLKGVFLSGMDFKATFSSFKDENAKLTHANELTFLKEGYDKIQFSFPDLEGKYVSLEDSKYQNKVVLLQIFGTWCPNCMDETQFYSNWYERNRDKDVEIIGLAYEAKDDFEYAKARVEKMKEKYHVNYDYLIAGVYDKEEAAKTLPMLNHVLSFPTTIFIDKKGKVRRIHTGFSGPATGKYYETFVDDFNDFMNQLINE